MFGSKDRHLTQMPDNAAGKVDRRTSTRVNDYVIFVAYPRIVTTHIAR